MANLAARSLSTFPTRLDADQLPDLAQGISALPRGAITEVLGETSSGRTALAHSMLATATLGGEVSAWIDCDDSFDPAAAAMAGADLGKLLWVQCAHKPEIALKAADMILHSGGFGLIILDLCGAAASGLQRVPLSYWYRVRRAVEPTPSVLLILGRESMAKSCAARQFGLERTRLEWRGLPPFQTMVRLETRATSRRPMSAASSNLDVLAEMLEAV